MTRRAEPTAPVAWFLPSRPETLAEGGGFKDVSPETPLQTGALSESGRTHSGGPKNRAKEPIGGPAGVQSLPAAWPCFCPLGRDGVGG